MTVGILFFILIVKCNTLNSWNCIPASNNGLLTSSQDVTFLKKH